MEVPTKAVVKVIAFEWEIEEFQFVNSQIEVIIQGLNMNGTVNGNSRLIEYSPLFSNSQLYLFFPCYFRVYSQALPYNDMKPEIPSISTTKIVVSFPSSEAVEKKMMSLIEQVLDKKVIDPCLGLVKMSEGKTPGAKGFHRRTANKSSLNMPKPCLF